MTLAEGLKEIGGSAFDQCTSLTSLELPEGLETIEGSVFEESINLTTVNFPDTLKTIGNAAFSQTNLSEVSLPQGLEVPESNPFIYCRNLSKITMRAANGEGTYCVVENDVLYNKDKTTIITYPGGKQGEYVMPDTVTLIAPSGFLGSDGLTKLTIPASYSTGIWKG